MIQSGSSVQGSYVFMSGGLDSTEKRVLQSLVDTSAELSTLWSM